MRQEEDNFVKILFRFYSNVLDEWTVETMWAAIVDRFMLLLPLTTLCLQNMKKQKTC